MRCRIELLLGETYRVDGDENCEVELPDDMHTAPEWQGYEKTEEHKAASLFYGCFAVPMYHNGKLYGYMNPKAIQMILLKKIES